MNNFIHYSTLAAACAVALTITSPTFAAGSYDPNDVGTPGRPDSFNRVITITPETKWVNVDDRESVKFVDSRTGQGFVWNFYTGRTAHFDLSKIAPPGMFSGAQVRAFVSEPPLPDRDN